MALDLASFEPLMGTPPYRVLDYHPDGMLVALQVLTSHPLTKATASFSGIWDQHTRRLVWTPENVIAMAWGSDGKEVGLLRERYTYDPGMHAIVGSALQSEFTYTWERRTWPEQMLLSSCPLVIPTGC